MPPITVTHIEDDETLTGYYIEWYDPANLDGLPLTGVIHITAEMCDQLALHQRRPNRAPETPLNQVKDTVKGLEGRATPPGQLGQIAGAFADAYTAIIQDRIDRHRFGLKAVTLDGVDDLEAVRAGAPVRPWNVADQDRGIRNFAKRRNQ